MTLELSNVANLPITIYHGMKIGQLSFVQLTEPASAPYGSAGLGSKYQGQKGPTPSAYWRNFEAEQPSARRSTEGARSRHSSCEAKKPDASRAEGEAPPELRSRGASQ